MDNKLKKINDLGMWLSLWLAISLQTYTHTFAPSVSLICSIKIAFDRATKKVEWEILWGNIDNNND